MKARGIQLKGVWLGDWGSDKTHRNPVTIQMDWDGKAITGNINPGPDAVRFTKAELDPASGWFIWKRIPKERTTRSTAESKISGLCGVTLSAPGHKAVKKAISR